MSVLELNFWVALGTVLLQALSLLLLIVYLLRPAFLSFVSDILGKHGLLIAFIFSVFGVAMSLVYSEYFGILPCGLCWLSRVFLYPQVVLLGVALFKRDFRIADYSIGLSVVGAVISLYHHYIQMGGNDVLPCPATGAGDCAKRFIFEFGYVTFPLIGFSLFAFLIILMLFVRRRAAAAV